MPKIFSLSLVARTQAYHDRTALIAAEGVFTYRALLDASAKVASCLLKGEDDLREKRVAFLILPGFHKKSCQRLVRECA